MSDVIDPCPKCGKQMNLDPEKINEEGYRFKCPACKHTTDFITLEDHFKSTDQPLTETNVDS